jgi:hypothetical protein
MTTPTASEAMRDDVTHGTLMLLAWGVLIPIAAAAPRMKFLLPNGRWFIMHQLLHLVGGVVFLVAVGLRFTNRDTREIDHAKMYAPHRGVGIALIALWATQFASGALRPHEGATDGHRLGCIPSEWRSNWYFLHAVLGQLVVGFGALAVVMGAVLIGDKYKGSDDAGVKFLASGGTYGVLAGVWALCSFAIWRDGFAKANGGIENYDIGRRLTPEELAAGREKYGFTGITVSGASSRRAKSKGSDDDDLENDFRDSSDED